MSSMLSAIRQTAEAGPVAPPEEGQIKLVTSEEALE